MNLEDQLIEACKYGDLEKVKKLVQNGTIPKKYSLIYASRNGFFNIVQFLVENGADVTDRDNLSLRCASQQGNLEVVKYLVENGADIHSKNNNALKNASQRGHLEVVRYLISKGSDTKVCTKEHRELLFIERFYKKWRRFLLRRWASKLLPVFYHPDSVGGKRDKFWIPEMN